MHLLHTVPHTFLMVLLERICSNITIFHLWWSFHLYSFILMTCLFNQAVSLLGEIRWGYTTGSNKGLSSNPVGAVILLYLKGLCHGSPVHFVKFFQQLALIAMELKVSNSKKLHVNDKRSEIWDKQICLLSIIFEVASSRDQLWKTVRLNSFQKS